jgi:hyperosmotically inducible periplasmic protein
MKSMNRSVKMVALPVLLFVTATFAYAAPQEPKERDKGVAQETKDAAKKTGTAVKDSWITMKISSQFVPEDALEGSDIDVDTSNGVVTLNGMVATEAGRAKANAIAKATDGVKSVNDRLRIGPAGADVSAAARDAGRAAGAEAKEAGRKVGDASRSAGDAAKETAGTTGRAFTDGWIHSKIAAQFLTEGALDDSDIDIDVSKGAVTLNGEVKTAAAKTRAAEIAKATDGVKNVKDNLKVK